MIPIVLARVSILSNTGVWIGIKTYGFAKMFPSDDRKEV